MQNAKRFVLHGARRRAPDDNQSGQDHLAARCGAPGNSGGGGEAPFSQLPNDVFVLRWAGTGGGHGFWRP